ncbi:Ig-like domain repeat protein [Nocardia aurea]|uniref:Ig-like domain repeat protein n=1 Tax=Nocardia aurea TaxID=2144174 RepID=UPI0033A94B61
MDAFNPNDYRKRVLAAVERRGGPEQSDSFELYDIPLDDAETLGDAEVAARVEEVWGFWQRQRDHPKYRVLVGLLVDDHDRRSELLLNASSRRAEATRVRLVREQRDAGRYEMLDIAVSRLVQRHGGIPASKVAGLEEIGAMGGLDAAEVAARLRRHKILSDQPQVAPAPSATLTEQRRKQIRQLLSEWDRLLEGQPAPTLFALLGLDPTDAAHTEEIRLRAEALRARSRELPPGRIRVVLDELLVHVQDLLEGGGPEVREYVRSIIDDVTTELRPKVRAAVLVEDQLVGEDYQFLLEEAMELGLDRAEAIRVLTDLTTALGARIESSPVVPPRPETPAYSPPRDTRTTSARASGRQWEEPLKAARGSLRHGRPQEAARQVAQARQLDNGAGTTPIRSVADEVERVLAEAGVRWRNVTSALAAKRYVEAVEHLEYLRRTASDVPPPTGRTAGLEESLVEARRAIAEADRLVAAAVAGPPADRARGLLAAREICADHRGVAEALAATVVEPPANVRVSRMRNGSAQVTWSPSPAGNVDYRVTRLQPDGSWRVVGRTRVTELEDGGIPSTGTLPVYAVAAALAGQYSEIARSDAPPPAGRKSATAQAGTGVGETRSNPTPGSSEVSPERTATAVDASATRRTLSGHSTTTTPATSPTDPGASSGAAAASSPAIGASPSASTASHAATGAPSTVPAASPTAPSAAAPAASQAAAATRPTAPGSSPAHTASAATPEAVSTSSTAPAASSAATGASPGAPTASQAATAAPSATTATSSPAGDSHAAAANSPASGAGHPPATTRPFIAGQPGSVPGHSPTAAVDSATPSTTGAERTADRGTPRDEPNPSGIPTVSGLAEHGGLLVFTWPVGVTEVFVVARADAPPATPDDPGARAWKVTNMRYEIDGGVKIPPDLPRPCHLAVASCRREVNGSLTIASGFAATARLHLVG